MWSGLNITHPDYMVYPSVHCSLLKTWSAMLNITHPDYMVNPSVLKFTLFSFEETYGVLCSTLHGRMVCYPQHYTPRSQTMWCTLVCPSVLKFALFSFGDTYVLLCSTWCAQVCLSFLLKKHMVCGSTLHTRT